MKINVALFTDSDNLFSIPLILSKYDYNPIVVKKEKLLYELLKKDLIQLLILDLKKSLDEELKFIEHIVSRKHTALPLIIISNEGSADALRMAMRMGIRYFLKKPFIEQELVTFIKEGVSNYKLTRENEYLIKKLKKKVYQLKMINDTSKLMNLSIDIDDKLEKLMKNVGAMVDASAWTLFTYNKKDNTLLFKHVIGEKAKDLEGKLISADSGIVGYAIKMKKSILVKDAEKDERFYEKIDEETNFNTKTVICVPIIHRDEVLGAIEVINRKDGLPFSEDDLKMVEIIVEDAAISIQNAILLKKTYSLTLLDHLTGLFNYRKLEILLDEMKKNEREFALFFMDLDNFKQVNDTYGHKYGSETLIEFAEILKEFIGENEFGFRYGGDEFLLLLPDKDVKYAKKIAKEIMKKMKKNKFLEKYGYDITLSVSIGISHYPSIAREPKNVLYQADSAMYYIKKSGKNGVALFGETRNGSEK